MRTDVSTGVPIWPWLVCVLVLLVWSTRGDLAPAAAQEQDRGERHRVPADFMSFRGAQWLERAERMQEERPDAVLDTMRLESGDVVADIGCGSGYYARRVAERVAPDGRVYCVDIQPEMLDIMRELADRDGVTGIVPVLGEPDNPKLPAGNVDWIILADVYHEMSDYEAMLAGMRASLAPGGRVALLEYRIEDGTGDNLKADHAMSVRQVLAEWQPAGFALAALHEFLPGQHLFIMKVAGDDEVPGDPINTIDLFEAVDQGLVEAEAIGAGDASVTVRVRNLGHDQLLVTMPVGVSFGSPADRRGMVSRRDAAIRLFDGEWHDWAVRAVGREHERPAAGPGNRFTVDRPTSLARLDELMHVIQVGTYRVADSPLLYIPRLHSVEQAAVWIAETDPRYDDIASAVQDERMPAQYAVAFGLVYCDLAGIDVTATRIWPDRERVFGGLRDPGLRAWYQEKTTGGLRR